MSATIQETEFLYTQFVDHDGFLPPEWYAHRVLKRTKKLVFVQHYYIGKMEIRKLNRAELETKGEAYWVRGSSHACFYTEAKKKRIEEYRRTKSNPECLKAFD